MGYSPSWVDRLTAWIAALPGSNWLYYSMAAGLLALLGLAIQWQSGNPPDLAAVLRLVATTAVAPYHVALMDYLDRRADVALETFRPALLASQEEYERLRRQLTTLPFWPTLLASLAGVVFILVSLAFAPMEALFEGLDLATTPASYAFGVACAFLVWWVTGALVYHTFHQLRAVNEIYTRHTQIDLFRLRPLYAFSGLSARTAIGINLIGSYSLLVVGPFLSLVPLLVVSTLVFFAVLGMATFALPLVGIHRLMVKEKDRLLDEAGQRVRAALAELGARLDQGELHTIDALHKLLQTLGLQQQMLERIPTWPWRPETVRGVASVFITPLVLLLLQFILQRFFNP